MTGDVSKTGQPSEPVVFADSRRTILVGTALAFIAATLYGANIPAARVTSQAGLPGADLIFWRAALFTPALFILALLLGQRLILTPEERGPTLRLALAASLTATFYLSSLDYLPVPMAVVLFYTFPLIVMLLSSRIEGRRLSPLQIGAFCVAFAGLLLTVGPSFSGLSVKGIALAIAGALVCAGLFILAGRVEDAPLRITFWTQAITLPVALGYALLHGGPASASALALAPIATIIAMGGYLAGYYLQMMAAARISASRTSLIFLFEPVTAIMLAFVLLGETISPLQAAGLVLILGALTAEVLAGTPGPRDAA